MEKIKEWEKVGAIDVDAGVCWIGDPCYIIGNEELEYPYLNWNDFCNKLIIKEKEGITKWKHHHSYGKGITVRTGYGDGTYPVYVKRNKEGRIAEVKIVFIEE